MKEGLVYIVIWLMICGAFYYAVYKACKNSSEEEGK